MKKEKVLNFLAWLAGVTLICGSLWWGFSRPVHSQVTVAPSSCSGTFTSPSSCSYSPTQLGANAITLPASGTTAATNTIDTRGVKQANLVGSCTQIANQNVNVFAEDGTTVVYNLTGTGGTGQSVAIHISSEQPPVNFTGSTSTWLELPQRALTFSWTNTTATAGTCTARLFEAY